MKIIIIILPIFIATSLSAQTIQKVVSGKIEHIENFQSQFVESRNIDIWLPAEYEGKKKFAVLYMHDGQMLFDSSSTWNHQSWNVDDIAAKLIKENKVQKFIVIGIWNIESKRHANYFPQKPFENLSKTEKDTLIRQLQRATRTTEVFQPNSDSYLKFLVTELKPMIDRKYSVYTDREHTFIAGSSMGGLISIYAISEYPSIFGGSASLSTHWIGSFTNENNPVPDAFINYLKANLPSFEFHKIYFDCGDQTLDAFYPPIQKKVDAVMKSKGYSNENWITKYFKGKDHTEKSWNERFHIPLIFLLGK
ncbi:alpha/beta hydrolase [Bacteroidota bacterium]